MTDASSRARRLDRLRERLAERGADAFFLPRTDQYGSEYLPANAERVAWLTGFTGSAAQVMVLPERAAVFSDGRYTVQLAQQVDEALFERRHIVNEPPMRWLEEHLKEGQRIGYDPFLVRKADRDRLQKIAEGKGGSLVSLVPDPVDEIWDDRPAPPKARVEQLDERWAGESSAQKRERIGAAVAGKGAEWLGLTSSDSIAWLLNIRGSDIPYNPLSLSFALLKSDGTCRWFVDPDKLPEGFSLGNSVSVEPEVGFLPALEELGGAKARVLVDPGETHVGYLEHLAQAGAQVLEGDNPIALAKARKNAVEIEGAVDAQRRDGAAVARFLAWLDRQPLDGTLTEVAVAERLTSERAKDPLFQGESFPAISAHGPNAALPHYRAHPGQDRALTPDTVYLVDSGAQYLDATTDITRTVALGSPSPEMRERFTLVLKGHIAIAMALFPTGATGAQIDSLARLALWRRGLDFDHGTGHGIGAYLCVHEGPQRIAKSGHVALEPGMIVSNEPGYYKSGSYGIRIENLVLVEPRERPEGADRDLLGFRTLTLCPIDHRLIDPSLLAAEEIAWLDAYHARVLEALSPLMDEESRPWLTSACAPLRTDA